jgi:hypothetical protein
MFVVAIPIVSACLLSSHVYIYSALHLLLYIYRLFPRSLIALGLRALQHVSLRLAADNVLPTDSRDRTAAKDLWCAPLLT